LPEQDTLVADDLITIYVEGNSKNLSATSTGQAIRSHLSSVKPNDYIALLTYTEETPAINTELQKIRLSLRSATKCATTVGYGPRFLHSTGQLHKGGPDTGVFFQITANDAVDYAVPGEPYTFSVLKQAQALGDFRSLAERGRRAIRVDLGKDTLKGLARLQELIAQATSTEPGAVATGGG
jgi:transaldolase / glucose-6-phosphate isomerase